MSVVETFYAAFKAGDGETMAACYAPDARFTDPAFGRLEGRDIGTMWRYLTKNARNFRLEVTHGPVSGDVATVNWVARYTFGKQARPVENHVTARIRVKDGFIVEHVDSFSFHGWARQALGLPGLLLGWLGLFQRLIQKQARTKAGITTPLPG